MNYHQVCSSLRDRLPSLFECLMEPEGVVRIRTPLLYPDGGYVDVFVVQRDEEYVVTDYGDALGWLRMESASESSLRGSVDSSMMLFSRSAWSLIEAS